MTNSRSRYHLGDIADVNWGDTSVTKASYTASGFVAYSASGPDGRLPYADFERTGVVLSAIGADCGKTWLASGLWSCIKNTIRFWATDPNVDTEYLYWVTREQSIWPKRGSAQPFISQGDARRLEVEVPTLAEQRAIVGILRALDDKIELNRRMNETLEAMAQALFKSWFVDFDPVREKLDGHGGYLPKGFADLFPASFVYSDGGEVPLGWTNATIGDFSSLNPEVWMRNTRPHDIHYIDLSNTKRGHIDAVAEYSSSTAPSRAQRVLRPGDTIVGTVRPGNGSYALISRDHLTGSTGFAVLRPGRPEYREFVYLAATRSENIERLAHLADGAAYPAVRPDAVANTTVVKPPIEIITSFSKVVSPVVDKISANQVEADILSALRDALLPKLISGEIRVKDAEKLASAAA